MANTANTDKLFTEKVKPIMDKVYSDLQHKKAEEMKKEMTSVRTFMASGAGPDGMMTGNQVAMDTVRAIGEWNSKSVDGYIDMVKEALKKNKIEVNAVMEKKMISYIIDKQVPKSAAEYIMSRTAKGSIFVLPELTRRTPMQNYITSEAEKKYNPSILEDATAGIFSWATNAGTTMGIGGFWGQTAADVAVGGMDYGTGSPQKYLDSQKAKAEKEAKDAEKKSVAIPKWMLEQCGFNKISEATDTELANVLKYAEKNSKWYRNKVQTALNDGVRTFETGQKTPETSVTGGIIRAKQYELLASSIRNEQEARKQAKAGAKTLEQQRSAESEQVSNNNSEQVPNSSFSASEGQQSSDNSSGSANENESKNQDGENGDKASAQADYSGWNNLLSGLGLDGIGDTFNHLGFTLASLPDMLVGILTGKTKSIGMNKGTMMPLAAIIAGTFIKNPLLKLPMMLWGGASLFNKMGQESLSDHRENSVGSSQSASQQGVTYKRYSEELLDSRISNPVIEGDKLVLNIDNVPRIVNLTHQMVDAYRQGALPINTLANRILAKSDQMQQSVSESQANEVSRRYEQNQQQEQSRGIR